MTFIADERFQSFYVENTGLWTLQIKYVQARDAGIYECQVSTEPKVSARVHLHVVGKYIKFLYNYLTMDYTVHVSVHFLSLFISLSCFYLMFITFVRYITFLL